MKDRILTILVTGADGQLGQEFRALAPQFPYYQFLFVGKADMDITDFDTPIKYFRGHSIEYCINCAAYTAVDKAESEREPAFLINAEAVAQLAKTCCQHNTQLIHISTDYVFDGSSHTPYVETDETNPTGVYGQSKLQGEALALQYCPASIIIRTSWLYSSYKNNFVKTMLRLMSEKESIRVVNDQYGSPTYAADLAMAIMRIIRSGKSNGNPGIYHYANTGAISWYEFAVAIKNLTGSSCRVEPISTSEYPTAAKRPAYSVLDTSKLRTTFRIAIPPWKRSLKRCLELLA